MLCAPVEALYIHKMVEAKGKTHRTTAAIWSHLTYRFIQNEIIQKKLPFLFRLLAYGPVKSLCVLHGVTVKGILRRVS